MYKINPYDLYLCVFKLTDNGAAAIEYDYWASITNQIFCLVLENKLIK